MDKVSIRGIPTSCYRTRPPPSGNWTVWTYDQDEVDDRSTHWNSFWERERLRVRELNILPLTVWRGRLVRFVPQTENHLRVEYNQFGGRIPQEPPVVSPSSARLRILVSGSCRSFRRNNGTSGGNSSRVKEVSVVCKSEESSAVQGGRRRFLCLSSKWLTDPTPVCNFQRVTYDYGSWERLYTTR